MLMFLENVVNKTLLVLMAKATSAFEMSTSSPSKNSLRLVSRSLFVCVYLRYQRRQAKTDALVHTHDETATPAPKTAMRCT